MADREVQRRLAAILAADVAGYTRLMEEVTDGTVAAWQDAREDVIKPLVADHSGKIVKLTGDGFLVEFTTVQNAVNCAITMQAGLASSRLDFRMGINLGDIIDDGEDIHGEGVNVAARLEGLADPGGIVISGDVYNQVKNRIAADYEDMGPQEVKNVSDPIQAYAIRTDTGGDVVVIADDRPSIAVLPFDNLSNDPDQTYFADGMSEDLITDLSKISGLFVIARNSSFSFKGQSIDIKEIAASLGVKHILEGSVRKMGNKIRINAQLIDAMTGGHLWADRYDGNFEDIFELQDDIREKIVAALEVRLNASERAQAERKPTKNMAAYDLFLRAREVMFPLTKGGNVTVRKYLENAIELDPEFSDAHAFLSRLYALDWVMMWRTDPGLEGALKFANRAVSLNEDSALAYAFLGWTNIISKKFDKGQAELEKSIALDPNLNFGYYYLGAALNYMGEPEAALEKSKIAERMDPIFPGLHVGHSHYLLKNYNEAVSILTDLESRTPGHPVGKIFLAATYSEMGEAEKARDQIKSLLTIIPEFTMATLKQRYWYKSETVMNRVSEALRKAGLPEELPSAIG